MERGKGTRWWRRLTWISVLAMTVAAGGPPSERREPVLTAPRPPVLAAPFGPGEEAVYDIRYGLLNAGAISLTVSRDPAGGGLWRFAGQARSSGVVRVFYQVDDHIDCWVDPHSFLPRRLEITVDESGERGTRSVRYDHAAGVAHYRLHRSFHKKRGPKEEERRDPLPADAFDVVSALYRLRMLDTHDGDVFHLPVHDNGKSWLARIEVGATRRVAVAEGTRLAVPFAVQAELEDKLHSDRDYVVWLSDDRWRVPVRFEAHLRFGTLKGLLRSYRPPATAEEAS